MAINLYGYSTQRINGLSSGMDTESLVNNSLASEQAKVDRLFQQKEKAQWKLDAYTELNKSVSSLRNSYLSILGEKSLVKSGTYNSYMVKAPENNALKVSGTADALPANFKVLSVTQAKSAVASSRLDSQQTEVKGVAGQYLRAQGQGTLTPPTGGMTEATTIGDMAEQFGLGAGESLSFAINGETFTFGQDKTLGEVATAINDNAAANVTMNINYDTGAVSLQSDVIGADTTLTISNIKGSAFGAADKGFGISSENVRKSSILGGADAQLDISTATFGDLATATGRAFTPGDMTINGTSFAVGAGDSIQSVMDRVNADPGLGVTMSYDNKSGTFLLRNKADGNSNTAENAAITVGGSLFGENSVTGIAADSYRDSGAVKRMDTLNEVARKLGQNVDDTPNITITINDKEFSFDMSKTTLSDMMYTINRDAQAGAAFTYSEMTDSFQISSANTGSSGQLIITGMDMFGLEQGNVQAGTDATLRVNNAGIERTIQQASNKFTLDGLSFEVTGDKDFSAEGGMSVAVERDYQPTIDAIKGFLEDYNKLMGDLSTKYYEASYSSYDPLTEEQRSAMTEKEAEKWDERAKSGILRNDAAIGTLMTNLRSALYTKVGDTGMSANDLGISTVAWSSDSWRTEQGKVTLDEDKLLAALKENPNAVQEVFTKLGSGESTSSVMGGTSDEGILRRMDSMFSAFNSTMRAQNISGTQTAINNYSERMTDMIVAMSKKEERLWAQYSQMETMLTKMQSEQSWITSQLGMMSNN